MGENKWAPILLTSDAQSHSLSYTVLTKEHLVPTSDELSWQHTVKNSWMDLDSRVVFIHSSVKMFFPLCNSIKCQFPWTAAPTRTYCFSKLINYFLRAPTLVASVWVLVLMCTPSWGEFNLAGFISQSGSVFILPEEGQIRVPSGQMQCVIAAQHPVGLNEKMCLMRTTCEKHPLINWRER